MLCCVCLLFLQEGGAIVVASRCWSFGTDHVFIRIVNDLFLFSFEFLYDFELLRLLTLKKARRPAFATIVSATTAGSNGWFTGSP